MSELPKVGDRVRLTFEGTVRHSYDTRDPFIDLGVNESTSLGFGSIKLRHADIEILPPPVENFKRGDTVRSKSAPSVIFSIGQGGYFDHLNGIWQPSPSPFTSRAYEKVEIG